MDEKKRKGPGSRGSAHDVEVNTDNFAKTEVKVERPKDTEIPVPAKETEKQTNDAVQNKGEQQVKPIESREHSISIENKNRQSKNYPKKNSYGDSKRFSGNGEAKFKYGDNRQTSQQFKKPKKDFSKSGDRFDRPSRFDDHRKQNTGDLTKEIETLKKKYFEQQSLISDIAKQKNDIKPLIASIVALIASIVAIFMSILPFFRQ